MRTVPRKAAHGRELPVDLANQFAQLQTTVCSWPHFAIQVRLSSTRTGHSDVRKSGELTPTLRLRERLLVILSSDCPLPFDNT
jgi:hypothetical protein